MSTDYHFIGFRTPVQFSFRSSTSPPLTEGQVQRMQDAAASTGIIRSKSPHPSVQSSSRPPGPSPPSLPHATVQSMYQSAVKSTYITHQAPIAWTHAQPSNPTVRRFYQPRVVAYQEHELIALNKELKLKLTDSQIQTIAKILKDAPQLMENSDPDGPKQKFIDHQSSQIVELKVRREGIHLDLGQIGKGGYKVVDASVKLAKLVHPRTSNKMQPPPFAKIKVEGTLIQQPKTAQEVEELQNEKRINQTLHQEARKTPESCSHIASSKWFTYESTGERGFRSEKMDGDIEKGNLSFTPKQRLQAAIGCCKGVAQLHQLGIIHRDVKPDNFLYKADAEGNITAKIADMGKAVNTKDSSSDQSTPSTWALKYLIPDIIRDQQAWLTNPARDDFALGLSLLEMFSPGVPFSIGRNAQGEIDYTLTKSMQVSYIGHPNHDTIPPEILSVIHGLLANADFNAFGAASAAYNPYEGVEKLTAQQAYQKLEKFLTNFSPEARDNLPLSNSSSTSRYGYASISSPGSTSGYASIISPGSTSEYGPLDPLEPTHSKPTIELPSKRRPPPSRPPPKPPLSDSAT